MAAPISIRDVPTSSTAEPIVSSLRLGVSLPGGVTEFPGLMSGPGQIRVPSLSFWMAGRPRPKACSGELDLCARSLEFGLDFLGLRLGRAFLDRLSARFHQLLGFLQAKAGNGADFLDHVDLLFAK